jgi:transposase InsO family protein
MGRRRFTWEFKLETVRLIKDRGVSYAGSRGLKVHTSQLRKWVKKFWQWPVLDRTFVAAARNRKWIADFTDVWTAEGWLTWRLSTTCSPGVWSAGQ